MEGRIRLPVPLRIDRMQGRHSSSGQITSSSLGAVTNRALPRSVSNVASCFMFFLDNYSIRTASSQSACALPQIGRWEEMKKASDSLRRLCTCLILQGFFGDVVLCKLFLSSRLYRPSNGIHAFM